MRHTFHSFLSLLGAFVLIAGPVAAAPSMHDHVGEAQRTFSDPGRSNWLAAGPRSVGALVWYPAVVDAADTRGCDDRRDCVHAGAPLSHGVERLPLILVSHGSGNHADQLHWLGTALARRGYLVTAVDHNGTREEELGGLLTATDFFAWERARDISVVLDALLADAELGPRVDRGRIGAAGFSLGGTTVLWLGGARLDLEALRTRSPPPPPFLQPAIDALIEYSRTSEVGQVSLARADRSYRDERIRAIFALSPAMGPGFPEEGLRGFDVPVFIAVGGADVIAPPPVNALHFAQAISGARHVVLPGERGHYTREIPADQRAAELAEVSELAAAFFAETLGTGSD